MKMNFNFNMNRPGGLLTTISQPIITRILCLTLLTNLVGFGAACVSTLHVHALPDGRLVAHSHPMPYGEGGHKHGHSQQEYAAVQAVSKVLDTGGITSDGEPSVVVPFPILSFQSAILKRDSAMQVL